VSEPKSDDPIKSDNIEQPTRSDPEVDNFNSGNDGSDSFNSNSNSSAGKTPGLLHNDPANNEDTEAGHPSGSDPEPDVCNIDSNNGNDDCFNNYSNSSVGNTPRLERNESSNNGNKGSFNTWQSGVSELESAGNIEHRIPSVGSVNINSNNKNNDCFNDYSNSSVGKTPRLEHNVDSNNNNTGCFNNIRQSNVGHTNSHLRQLAANRYSNVGHNSHLQQLVANRYSNVGPKSHLRQRVADRYPDNNINAGRRPSVPNSVDFGRT